MLKAYTTGYTIFVHDTETSRVFNLYANGIEDVTAKVDIYCKSRFDGIKSLTVEEYFGLHGGERIRPELEESVVEQFKGHYKLCSFVTQKEKEND